jgi:hypothetical protein
MHELSSLARTLGSGIRIPLKAWVSLCAFILCFCCHVCGYRPCDELITRQRNPTVCVRRYYETEEEARAQQRAVEPLMNISKIRPTSVDIVQLYCRLFFRFCNLVPFPNNFLIFVWFPVKTDMYLPCILQNKVCLELKMVPPASKHF